MGNIDPFDLPPLHHPMDPPLLKRDQEPRDADDGEASSGPSQDAPHGAPGSPDSSTVSRCTET